MNAPAHTSIPLLDLDLLRTLVAIADTGNFSQAADVVFRTPSAVSMQVKRIEEIVGRPVFRREGRGVSLNEDGDLLVSHARRVLLLNRDILARFASEQDVGIVRLGALDHAVDTFLPSVLCRFSETHPGIRVDVTVENSAQLRTQFQKNELDVIVITCLADASPNEQHEIIATERLIWAGLKDGIACEQDPLPVSVWEEGCIWRKSALDGLASIGRDYRINFMSAHIAGQKAGVLADLAVAPLPESAISGRIVSLEGRDDLPDLPDFGIGMCVAEGAAPHIQALAAQLRLAGG